MHSGGSRILQLVEGAIYMLDQLSCVVGALHFGEIWNQLGEGGIKPPTVLTLAPPPPPATALESGSATDTDLAYAFFLRNICLYIIYV